MTFNVNYGNPHPADALDAIAAADADIVLLQEVTSEWKRQLAAHFAEQYPHQLFRVHSRAAGGLAVLVQVPDLRRGGPALPRARLVPRAAPRVRHARSARCRS